MNILLNWHADRHGDNGRDDEGINGLKNDVTKLMVMVSVRLMVVILIGMRVILTILLITIIAIIMIIICNKNNGTCWSIARKNMPISITRRKGIITIITSLMNYKEEFQ